MTFSRRLDLLTDIRALVARREFAEAGSSLLDRLDAARLTLEIDQIYWNNGVLRVFGDVDGEQQDERHPNGLWYHGPEDFVGEVLAQVRKELGLSEEERKN